MIKNEIRFLKETFKSYLSFIIINFNFDNLKLYIPFNNFSFIIFNINYINSSNLEKLYNFGSF